jgi:hypothetical protein
VALNKYVVKYAEGTKGYMTEMTNILANETTDMTHSNCVQSYKRNNISLWTLVPREIRDRILSFADPLTKYLHHFGEYSNWSAVDNSFELALIVWKEALKQNWTGGLILLPKVLPDTSCGLLDIKCRDMFRRLYALVSNQLTSDYVLRYREYSEVKVEPLIVVPMNNMWIDIVDEFQLPWEKLLDYSIKGAYLQYFLHLEKNYPGHITTNHYAALMEAAAFFGKLDVVTHLDTRYDFKCTTNAMDYAAMNGHLETVRYLHAHRHEGCTEAAMNGAIDFGSLEVVHFLYCHGLQRTCSPSLLIDTAFWGYFDIFKFMLDKFEVDWPCIPFSEVGNHGNIGIMNYLLDRFPDEPPSSIASGIRSAIRKKHIDFVEKFHHIVQPDDYNGNFMADAVYSGSFHLVQLLHLQRSETWSEQVLVDAAECGHADILEYLHTNGSVDITHEMFEVAAINGHLECLKFLCQICPLKCPPYITYLVERQGHAELLAFMNSQYNSGVLSIDIEISEEDEEEELTDTESLSSFTDDDSEGDERQSDVSFDNDSLYSWHPSDEDE